MFQVSTIGTLQVVKAVVKAVWGRYDTSIVSGLLTGDLLHRGYFFSHRISNPLALWATRDLKGSPGSYLEAFSSRWDQHSRKLTDLHHIFPCLLITLSRSPRRKKTTTTKKHFLYRDSNSQKKRNLRRKGKKRSLSPSHPDLPLS